MIRARLSAASLSPAIYGFEIQGFSYIARNLTGMMDGAMSFIQIAGRISSCRRKRLKNFTETAVQFGASLHFA
jgi:hypothetical protein